MGALAAFGASRKMRQRLFQAQRGNQEIG
jgi:hypothetical protein